MKKRILSYLLFVSILITLSSCAGSKLSVNKGDISIKKNDNGYSVIANGIYEGVEILFDGIIDMEEVRTSSDVLKIVQNSNGKTYVAVCKTDEVFKSGSELMLLEVENVPNVLETICVRKSSASNFKVNSRDANPILLGDFDGNQIVNLIDFMIFRQKYRTATGDGVYEELYDISPAEDVFDGIWEGIYDTKLPDGVVNILDFIIFKRNYKKNTSGVVEGPVVIDERLSSVCEGMTIAPNSVIRVAWKKIKGKSMMCNVKLYKNEELVQNIINVPEADFHIEGEGDYSIEIISATNDNYSTKISFKSTKLYEEMYQSSNGVVYVDSAKGLLSGAATDVDFKFYKYSSYVLPGTDETINERIRLNLVDTNSDGIYDAWTETTNAQQHPWLTMPYELNAYSTVFHIKEFVYYENKIDVRFVGISGVYTGAVLTVHLATVGFELNVPHSRYFLSQDDAIDSYGMFMLRERYDSDTKPVIDLDLDAPLTSGSRATTFKVKVTAENVANFAEIYDTKFMQLAVNFDDDLALTKVEFTNFFDGKKEVSAYKMNADNNAVILYKGIMEGEEQAAPLSTDFAILTFEVKPLSEATSANINLVYEGYWDTYVTYPDLPNPTFKDSENRSVDGFVIDFNPLTVEWGGNI